MKQQAYYAYQLCSLKTLRQVKDACLKDVTKDADAIEICR